MINNFKDRYTKLNAQQKEAVDTIYGPLMVIAGPGTGKTELLSLRVANILQNTDTNPESILCLTFTESGREAMRKRLSGLIGSRADDVSIFTFHGFCGYLKNKYGEHFWKGNSFEVAGELVEYNILEHIFQNMEYSDPLKKFHSEDGYIFLKDVKSRIKDLKEAGVLPEDFLSIIKQVEKEYLEINNELSKFINERVSDKMKIKYEEFLKFLISKGKGKVLDEIKNSLEIALEEEGLSDWKKEYTEEENGERHLKRTKYIDKMHSLQNIYLEYEKKMREEKVIDYSDIILNTLLELKRNEILRVEIQEYFQFILVDEFQDTNNAQFEILKILTSHPVHEGRPNIMVVGDDDQAVYRFQGGDIKNILDFKNIYTDVKIIVLEENYRSTQKILDLGKSVIENSGERYVKNLKANTEKEIEENHTPTILQFENEIEETDFILQDIKEKIAKNIPAHEIAIIAKKHKQLENVAIYLNNVGIKYSYEKETSLLENPKINGIITILRCINSLYLSKSNIENYIPEILTFSFFKIPKMEILKLAVKIRKEKTFWYEEILNSENEYIKKVGDFLQEITTISSSTPLYHVIDKIIIDSGFKNFYFSEINKQEYLNFLEDLKTLYNVIKNYKKQQILYVKDINFVLENIKKYGLNIKQNTEINKEGHVTLLTSHKSKGLEYQVVYLLNMNKKYWASKGKNTILPFLYGMPYTRYKEEEGDFVRSVYVAMTRAKKDLVITHTENLLSYFGEKQESKTFPLDTSSNKRDAEEKNITFASMFISENFNAEEKDIFKPLLENYKISPTHLNSFLDIINAGPAKFIEDNLLHFPSPSNEHSLFGTLMHNVLEIAGKYKMQNKKDLSLKVLQNNFKENLEKEILTRVEYEKILNWGFETIENYYFEIKKFGEGGLDEKFEVSFSYENVVLDDAKLTGNIDRIQISRKDNEIIIFDYKTGKNTVNSWDVKDDIQKIKLHKYKNQLLFYKIILENSKEFKNFKIKIAVLDFIEINKKHNVLYLNYDEEKEALEKMRKLIKVVYEKIQKLDFPDISKYSQSMKGILDFEEDLISGKL